MAINSHMIKVSPCDISYTEPAALAASNTRYLRYKDLPFPASFPIDFDRMKSDDEFINYLSGLIGFRNYGINVYTKTIEETQKVIDAIEQEMERLKS